MVILKVEEITKQFGGLTAVNKLSFSLEKGRVLGIVGPNGSGKSTTLNLITGFVKPDSGRVFLKDENVTNLKPHKRVKRGMARTFQISKVFRYLSVHDNIKAAAIFKTKRDQNPDDLVTEAINLIGLKGKEREEAIHLSIGDLKRLEIGRALVIQPNLLLLDEPFAGLSHKEVADIIYLLKDLLKRGLSIVVVEHVLRELRNMTEDVIVLNFGVKIAEGKFEDIMNQEVVREAYLGSAINA